MSNPTSNFNWQMPTATDLVTDLPADFEVFGQAVDTSLADLKGGTTGQVLSKTSGTDMDFTWVDTDDTNAIQNAIVDAKGDLIAASAADTPARLAVGANGETLVADSSTSTGLRYQGSQAAGKNAIINGAFDIWQRATSGTISTGTYVAADRFNTYRAVAGSTFSRQTASLTGFQYSGRIARDSGNTSTSNIAVSQSIESINSIPYAGQTIVLSFWAKAGANYSATSNILRVRFLSSTSTDANILVAGGTTVIDQNATLTTSWQRFSYSAAVGSNAITVGTIFSYDPTGTAGAADNFEVTGVEVQLGSVATAFTRAGGNIAGELQACQRYYYLHAFGTSGSICNFLYFNSTTATAILNFPVQMRVAPTLSATTGTSYYAIETGSNLDYVNSLTLAKTTTTATQLYNASEAAGTVGLSGIGYTNNSSASLAFNAEL
jgi:hypothetical protein